MRKYSLWRFLLPLSFLVIVFISCHDDSYLTIPPQLTGTSFVEEFDTISAASTRGWKYINVSDPLGSGVWTQGLSDNPDSTGFPANPFPAYSSKGVNVGFIGADYTSTSAGAGIISNWVVSPVTVMKYGDKIIFYTRGLEVPTGAGDSTDYANRLQVRASTKGESVNVGSGTDPGDFTSVLLDINPFYHFYDTDPTLFDATAYPALWTRFIVTVSNINGPVKGRFAFRYFIEGGGSNGYGTAIGIDSVAYISSK